MKVSRKGVSRWTATMEGFLYYPVPTKGVICLLFCPDLFPSTLPVLSLNGGLRMRSRGRFGEFTVGAL